MGSVGPNIEKLHCSCTSMQRYLDITFIIMMLETQNSCYFLVKSVSLVGVGGGLVCIIGRKKKAKFEVQQYLLHFQLLSVSFGVFFIFCLYTIFPLSTHISFSNIKVVYQKRAD